jgi:ATP-binding protein involved in chromosome partitioning
MPVTQLPAVLIGGGKGGVGKSSVTAGLARGLAGRDLRVGLLDADLSGPSQGLLFECADMAGADGQILPARSADGVLVASSALISRSDSALVWSGPTATAAIDALTQDRTWRDADVLLVDLPPGHGETAVTVARQLRDAITLLVTTGSELATQECRRAARFFQRMEVSIAGIIENMAEFECRECGAVSDTFPEHRAADLAGELGVPLMVRVPFGADVAHAERLDPVFAVLAEHLSWRTDRQPARQAPGDLAD